MATIWLQGRRRYKMLGNRGDCYNLDDTDPITKIWTDPPTLGYELCSGRHGAGDVLFTGAGTTYPLGITAASVKITGTP